MALAEQKQIEVIPVEETILNVTPAAEAVIGQLIEQRNIPGHVLRVFVAGGGCSGLQYGMSFEQDAQDFDKVVRLGNDVRLVIDPTSLVYLKGANIDFVDSLMGGGFRIENPNAVSSCGCGSSFRTKDNAEASASDGCGSCSH